jgi:four helix bundle protein
VAVIRIHRDLIVWQKGRVLAREVYRVSKTFPADERFGLTLQARRAAVSVPSNVAEGFGRGTTADFLRHLRIARGSLAELDTQLVIASDLGYLAADAPLSSLHAEVDRVLQALIRKLEEKIKREEGAKRRQSAAARQRTASKKPRN